MRRTWAIHVLTVDFMQRIPDVRISRQALLATVARALAEVVSRLGPVVEADLGVVLGVQPGVQPGDVVGAVVGGVEEAGAEDVAVAAAVVVDDLGEIEIYSSGVGGTRLDDGALECSLRFCMGAFNWRAI